MTAPLTITLTYYGNGAIDIHHATLNIWINIDSSGTFWYIDRAMGKRPIHLENVTFEQCVNYMATMK